MATIASAMLHSTTMPATTAIAITAVDERPLDDDDDESSLLGVDAPRRVVVVVIAVVLSDTKLSSDVTEFVGDGSTGVGCGDGTGVGALEPFGGAVGVGF